MKEIDFTVEKQEIVGDLNRVELELAVYKARVEELQKNKENLEWFLTVLER